MAKFYGKIGYAETTETSPGVWTESITELDYRGDFIKNIRRLQSGENVNDDISLNNMISIIADPFAYQNFHTIRYAKWLGAAWKVTSVEVQHPRLLLTMGGVYNE